MQTNEYGLVPGKALKSFEIYKGGQPCGFEPSIALKLQARGVWAPTNPENAAVGTVAKKAAEVEANESETFAVAVESGTLLIPKNWREVHHAKRTAWAKQISGEKDINVARAEEIIAEAVKSQEQPAE
jgi:hypothetical protein